jgi:hypothetical protein
MHALTLTRRIESDHLPELNSFIGQDVDIVITPKQKTFDPATRWAALKALAGSGILDMDAIRDAERVEWEEAEHGFGGSDHVNSRKPYNDPR